MKIQPCYYTIAIFVCLGLLLGGSMAHFTFGYFHRDLSGNAWGADDAYISYRYAKNFAQKYGLVFNPGERVEGYSNFLYVLLISTAFFAGIADTHVLLFSTILNLCFITIAFLIYHQYLRQKLDQAQVIVALFLFAACPIIWVWVASGMETALVILLQISLWVSIERTVERESSLNLLLCVLTVSLLLLARADGFISPLIAIAYFLLRNKKRSALIVGVTLLSTVALYILWRYSYYGYPLPNTYYAKVSSTLGTRLLYASVQLMIIALNKGLLAYLVIFIVSAGVLVKNIFQNNLVVLKKFGFETIFALGWLAYWFYIGGDIFFERFLVILFPLGIFKLVKLIGRFSLPTQRLIAGVVLLIQLSPFVLDSQFDYSLTKYDRWVHLGHYLAQNYQGKTLAIDAAGKVPFFSNLKTIDMLGLNDAFLAHTEVTYFSAGHNKFDPDYVLSQNPDLVAAWVVPCDHSPCRNMDLRWGLSKEKYESFNYRLKYLVNTRQKSVQADIIDVYELDEKAILNLINDEYRYAVLEKQNDILTNLQP